MTAVVRTLVRNRRVRVAFLAVVAVLAAVAALSFVVTAGGTNPEPVPFEDTTTAGLTAEQRQLVRDSGLTVPKAEVFYSQYKWVVGYRGIEFAVTDFQQPGHEQQFGYPIAVWVSDYTDTGVGLTEERFVRSDRQPGWVRASAASFVTGSEARTPAGETVVPFASETAASSFAESYGGEVVGWGAVQRYSFDIDRAAAVRNRIDDQHADGDERADVRGPDAAGSTLADGDGEPRAGVCELVLAVCVRHLHAPRPERRHRRKRSFADRRALVVGQCLDPFERLTAANSPKDEHRVRPYRHREVGVESVE